MKPMIIPEAVRAIHDLGKLEDGWDSYDAPPPSATAMKKAIAFLKAVEAQVDRVSAVANGGVALIIYGSDTEFLSFEFCNNGEVIMGLKTDREISVYDLTQMDREDEEE